MRLYYILYWTRNGLQMSVSDNNLDQDDEIKEACSTSGKDEKCIKDFRAETWMEKDRFHNLVIDGRTY